MDMDEAQKESAAECSAAENDGIPTNHADSEQPLKIDEANSRVIIGVDEEEPEATSNGSSAEHNATYLVEEPQQPQHSCGDEEELEEEEGTDPYPKLPSLNGTLATNQIFVTNCPIVRWNGGGNCSTTFSQEVGTVHPGIRFCHRSTLQPQAERSLFFDYNRNNRHASTLMDSGEKVGPEWVHRFHHHEEGGAEHVTSLFNNFPDGKQKCLIY
jgi:hypothetical protein